MENTGKNFRYITSRLTREYPFRAGDFVVIKDWGGIYDLYSDAFRHFYGSPDPPYYAVNRHMRTSDILGKRRFRVVAVAEHSDFDFEIVCYLKDMTGASCVMGIEYLAPVKVYPLRPGETYDIKLDKIRNTFREEMNERLRNR